jgi:PAS domain S-box-containing protein
VQRALRETRLRREAEEASRQRRIADERLQLALSSSPITAFAQDPELRITWLYGSKLGFSEESALGKTEHDLLPEASADRLAEVKRAALETGQPVRREVVIVADGEMRAFDLMVHPNRDALGTVTGITCVSTDITERKKLQEALAERERLAAVGTAAAMLAHEIANPLNGMYVHAQLLERRAVRQGADELVEGIRGCRQEIERLADLLNEFRQVSKRPQLQSQAIDARQLVVELLDEVESRHAPASVGVVREVAEAELSARLDRSKTKQVLLNLCKNAIEAMGDGGTLTFRAHVTEGHLTFEVCDTGCGMPADIDPFEAFRTTKAEGTGLGLAISRQLVQAQGGTIRFESEPGKGTSFFVVFPCNVDG